MGSGGDGSVTEAEPVATQDTPERDENFTYEFYVSDAGVAALEYRSENEAVVERYKYSLAKLIGIEYPKPDQTPQSLIKLVRDKFVWSPGEPKLPACDVVYRNDAILHLALRNRKLLAACRAPELRSFWQECINLMRINHSDSYLPYCPVNKHPFDHLMGAHLHAIGRHVLTNRGEDDSLTLSRTEQFVRTKQALGFFIEASQYGYSFSVKTVLDFYLNTVVFADAKHLLGLVDDLLALTDTVPLALGILGYLIKSSLCASMAALIGQRKIKTGISSPALDEKQRLCSREAFIAALIAKRSRFMPEANEYLEMHRAYLKRTEESLRYSVDGSFDEDDGFWQSLIAFHVPDEFLKNKNDVVPHMFLNPGEHALTDDGSRLSEDYAKRYFLAEDIRIINEIIASVNAQAQGIMDARETLITEPFVETAKVLSKNLPSNTHPDYHPFWRFRAETGAPSQDKAATARSPTPAIA